MWDKTWDFLKSVNFKYKCHSSSWSKPTGGVVIASKHEIEYCKYHKYYEGNGAVDVLANEFSENLRLPECANVDCAKSKGVLYAKVKKGAKKYNVFATHMNANYHSSENDKTYGKYHTVRLYQ